MAKVTARKVLDIAAKYIGVTEYPPNSNKVIFNTAYYGKEVSGAAYPWCAVFMWYIFREAGASDLFCGGGKYAYTPSIANFYKSKGKSYSIPKPGDLVLFKFPGSNRINHIGIVERVLAPNKIQTIEGNTSVGNNTNGGAVMRRTRATNYVACYCRPDYFPDNTVKTETTYKQSTFIADVQSILGVDISGVGNQKTLNLTPTISKTKNRKHKLVIPLQKYFKSLNLYNGTIDGEAGPKFDTAVRAYQKAFSKNPDGEITSRGVTWKKLLGMI